MSIRRIVDIPISGLSAAHRDAGTGDFRFDPEAWVDLAYPAQESVMAEIGGKKIRRKARFTSEGFHKMVAGFEAEKARRAAEGVEHALLGNRDHLALMRDDSTEAYGWLDGLKVGEDGHLWGHVKWTSLGKEAAAGGVYRFVSVEVADSEGHRKPADAVLEWDRIDGFAVTNQPALSRLRPFAHRDGETIEENTNPKGKQMENLKKMLGLAPEATDADVEAAVQALVEAKANADSAAAEAEMCKKANEFAAKHSKAFPDQAAAVAFYRAAPEKAEELVGRFRIVETGPTEAEKALDAQEATFVASHGKKFVDEKGARAFFRAEPATAEERAAQIRMAPVSHRGGGNPDEKDSDLTPKAVYSKYQAMPEGDEKEAFFDAHRIEINAGAVAAEAEQK